ncbi:MAG: outer membrane beta-barrel protein [Bdellovibrionia bacterium]
MFKKMIKPGLLMVASTTCLSILPNLPFKLVYAEEPKPSSDITLSARPNELKNEMRENKEPFAFADFTWLNGNSRQTKFPFDSKYITGEFSFDSNYAFDFNHPNDHTLVGSSNSGRTSEVQVQHLAFGGDLHYENIRARVMTQFGLYSTMTPRSDPSVSRGQWDLGNAYRYVTEAYGGYHWDVWNGINLDVGLFMSYLGLCSYYNYENWVYQMSYVSANTPWFFNGLRLQLFPSDKFKAEVWLINGWQSYGMFNEMPGIGTQLLWRPNGSISLASNEYIGKDTLNNTSRIRIHSDNSIQVKYLDNPKSTLDKGAFSLTLDIGCEVGGGVNCLTGDASNPAQNFVGIMAYNRFWFANDSIGLTIGGGAITNPGRYLVLLPPINGATSASGTPYFTASPGDSFTAWDSSITFDIMPSQFATLRFEFTHRQASIPYFSGGRGITPPGGNSGFPGSAIAGWQPDLQSTENRINIAYMVRL